MFSAEVRKNNVYSCKSQFYDIKVGLSGSKLSLYVFVIDCLNIGIGYATSYNKFFYTDTRYNDRIRYNDSLIGTKHLQKSGQLVRNYARPLDKMLQETLVLEIIIIIMSFFKEDNILSIKILIYHIVLLAKKDITTTLFTIYIQHL